ncbi:helix-turn-helix transcriptional regulator [Sphingomonas sp. So64.6b]|uniref:helix-turn-helix domain-containing protein n=1 Tax=Sphingomonas sp. So64.6b TaxID=2997354 RepID=UPI001602D373|nr:helix-turn-helix transcriptional regulator [Sphingomonas sp. So64.6b]QNA85940.1 helix-turn-helix transcriptional regulator [Sphingomonas sp. So64.6b]
MRGTCEQPGPIFRQQLAKDHPVASMMATGDPWLLAWRGQALVRLDQLARDTGIPVVRLFDIERGESITLEELISIARVIHADPAELIASLPDPALLIA